MGREARRVPLDFDWPMRETWAGYLLPERLRERECLACGGEGYGPEARAIAHTFYPHMIPGDRATQDALAWHNKIGQREVDHLVKTGRLAQGSTAAEVNAAQGGPGLPTHDAISRGILIEYRCKRLGIDPLCVECGGHGYVEVYPGQRAEGEAWEPADPPTGDGWQMWETTSEGSPVSPVFDSPEALAEWCVDGATVFGSARAGYAEWLAIITGKRLAAVQIAPGVVAM